MKRKKPFILFVLLIMCMNLIFTAPVAATERISLETQNDQILVEQEESGEKESEVIKEDIKLKQQDKNGRRDTKEDDKDKVIVLFKNNANQELITNSNGTVHHEFENIPALAISVPQQAIGGLKNNPNVISVEKNERYDIQGQTTPWGIAAVDSPQAWSNDVTGKDVKVAIIDSGVDTSHPDLSIAGCYGASDAATCEDVDGHGTHVAGTVGARNNEIGVVGVAPDVDIYAARVSNLDGEIWSTNVLAAIDWAISKEVDIINLSLGSNEYSRSIDEALTNAYDKGILSIAASGNDSSNSVSYPAALANVIAVSATDKNNEIASFSNTGEEIEFSAPGVAIDSTTLNGDYAKSSGTSMATPHVAGVLALLIETYPDMNRDDLRATLRDNALDLGPKGRDSQFGYGLVQAPDVGGDSSANVPDQPSNLAVDSVKSDSLKITWNAQEYTDYYKVTVKDVGEFETTEPEFQINDLSPNTTYQVNVSAINTEGFSEDSSIDVLTLLSPTELDSENVTSNIIELRWVKNNDATYYELYRDDSLIYSGTEKRFIDKELQPETTYSYHLIAKNNNNKSELSMKYTVETLENFTDEMEEKVLKLQTDLKNLGFFDQQPNGKLNNETEASIIAFQEYFGYEVTGLVNEDTLLSVVEVLSSPLRNGQYRETAIQLKKDLAYLGFHISNHPTTFYGPKTEEVVRDFQKEQGLRVNGIADEVTLKKIQELLEAPMANGTYRQDVIMLKERLATLDFYISNNPTIFYGPVTEETVRSFQKYYKLEETGVASKETLAKIDEVLSSPLRNGQYRETAIQLKKDLAYLGFHISNHPTTFYGPKTEEVVRDFQKEQGLRVNGIADEVTLKKIQELLEAPMANGTYRQDVITLKERLATLDFYISNNPTIFYGPVTEETVRSFQKYYKLEETGVAGKETLAKIDEVLSSPLRNGQYHETAISLKENLSHLGFHVSNHPTTYYGPITENTVKAFQKQHGLRVSGIADKLTLKKIEELL
ncbi:peptidoglycan-binding protein [Salipaludibacillus sp. HK11]|uniref:peptidoglycan-binding protein n=1 Tax=Salipaludibacillus sp. HK11 TaxID=3394320 RepID=UPI0039FCF57B